MTMPVSFSIPVPAGLADVEAAFSMLFPTTGDAPAGVPAGGGMTPVSSSPNDPFAVLLAAASSGTSDPSSGAAAGGTSGAVGSATASASPTATATATATATSPSSTAERSAADGTALAVEPAPTSPAEVGSAVAGSSTVGSSTVGSLAAGSLTAGSPVAGSSTVGSPIAGSPGVVTPTTSAAAVSAELASLSSPAASTASSETLPPAGQAAIETADSSPGATSGGVAVVADATRYLGVPYVWGGTSPTTGFDCSGLVQHVFGDLGVSLPRTSYEQVDVGTPVANLSQAEPGDLLFFEPGQNGAGPGQPGHVAIYIGDNEMIAAPETGETVQVQQVPTAPMAIRRVPVPVSSPDPASTATSPSLQSALADSGEETATAGADVSIGGVSVPAQYVGLIDTSAEASGVPAPLLAAELQTESGFDPGAVSNAGAEGIAQFMPATAAELGVQPFDPSSAIPGAAHYLASLENQLGSWSLAVAAYNAGPSAVVQSGGIPDNGQTPTDVATVLKRAGLNGETT